MKFNLLFIISLPIILETNQILTWWLKIVPEYTASFLQIILITSIVDSTANSLMIAAQATGKIRVYQSIIGGILLLILPISYLFLIWGYPPEIVFVVHLSITCIAWVVRLLIVRHLANLPIKNYLREVIIKIMYVVSTSIIVPILIWYFMPENFVRFIIVTLISILVTGLSIYFLGLDKTEQTFIVNNVRNTLKRVKK